MADICRFQTPNITPLILIQNKSMEIVAVLLYYSWIAYQELESNEIVVF
jgi:hypothetical protein